MSKHKKNATAADVIRARRIALNTNQEYKSLFLRVVVLALAAYVVFTQVFLITQNKGLGMFPAMKDGDLIIAYRLYENVSKNDIVVYEVDGEEYVGRVLGKNSDSLVIDENGTLKLNGITQSGEIFYPTYSKDGMESHYELTENQVFVLGDYRTNTIDSRDFGPISIENIKGKVISILRRRGL